ncbi:hypothetical protein AYO44_00645 [Planctomycetaceae bacterium SCGC AG-212-F19]|nr:hypothetical protein AYO44_00645 [Planctomycetaceae bacterium SCGC AG-212-F19]
MKNSENSNSPDKLSHDLDSYSASVQSRALANSMRKLLPRWSAYAAAVGSSLAMTTSADASIVYSGVLPQPANTRTIATGGVSHTTFLNFKMDLARSSLRFTLFNATAKLGGVSFLGLGPHKVFGTGTRNVQHFFPGNAISAAGALLNGGGLIHKRSSSFSKGNFPAHSPVFLGVELKNGVAGGTEFGWVRFSFQNGPGGYPNQVKLIDWAYDNSGAAINAGQIQPVPEPSSLLLTILAAGSAGVLAWRKRRQAAAAAASSEPSA